MKKQVYDYFLDLEKKDLPRKKGVLTEDGKKIKRLGIVHKANSARAILKYNIAEAQFFCKTEGSLRTGFVAHEIASSKMYGDLGLITPPVYYMKRNGIVEKYPCRISQDACIIDGISIEQTSDISALQTLPIKMGKDLSPYAILYDKNIREALLAIMTEECFMQLVNMFVAGDLRTDADMHPDNYFLYKEDGSEKYTGIMPIDLEHSQAILYKAYKKDDFDSLAKHKTFDSCIPFKYGYYGLFKDGYLYTGTHDDRLKNIANLIQSGKLNASQVSFIKNTINYDLPGSMRAICTLNGLNKKQQQSCDSVARLWDYNRKVLEKEF